MDGLQESSTARRVRAHLTRAALVAVIALVALLAVPGTAAAGGTVKPILNCYVENRDGSWTVVVGYVNSARNTEKIRHGADNRIYPSKYQGVQPTSFKSGTVNGAFTMRVTVSDLYANARWELDGHTLDYRAAASASSQCPASTELPEEGNGTGPAIGLAAAGLVGAVLVHRARKRALAVGGRGDA